MTINDMQNTMLKAKGWATRNPLKTGVNLGAPEGLAVPAPLTATLVLLLLQTRCCN